MSGVSLSSEFAALDEAFGIGLGEMEWLTINAMKSAFAPFDERLRLINEVVKPGYARLRAEEVAGRRQPAEPTRALRASRARSRMCGRTRVTKPSTTAAMTPPLRQQRGASAAAGRRRDIRRIPPARACRRR